MKTAPSRGGAAFVSVPGYVYVYVYLKAIKILRRKKKTSPPVIYTVRRARWHLPKEIGIRVMPLISSEYSNVSKVLVAL